jgi:cardiolipin synthase A/B
MKLLVEPDDGFAPLMKQVKAARHSIDTTIFRFDLRELQKAFEAAVVRGVQVRALIAHTNSDGEKRLRKLETDLLAAGVILARSGDDLLRYHGKMLIVDRSVLHVMLFNYTRLDIDKSRSFAVSTRSKPLVEEALRLFEADMARQPYSPGCREFVVSPENSRTELTAFIRGTREQLLIYDPKLTDPPMIARLQELARKGVEVRVLGRLAKRGAACAVSKLCGLRLHARVMIRDSSHAFLGSQSLRKAELDQRRELGIVVGDAAVVRRLKATFETDWAQTKAADRTGLVDEPVQRA